MKIEIIDKVIGELEKENIGYKICNGETGHFNLYKNNKYIMSYWCFSLKYHIPNGNVKGSCSIKECIEIYKEQIKKGENKMKEKSIEELERESAEIRLKIDKAMEKSMKDIEKTDKFFKFIQIVLIVMLLASIGAVISSIRIDNELLETYDSCVDVNGERYCRVDE